MIKKIILVFSLFLNLFLGGWLVLLHQGDRLLEWESQRHDVFMEEKLKREVSSE